MSPSESPSLLDQIEAPAQRLCAGDRARLAERLIRSLDDLDEEECGQLWAKEAERRYEMFRKGQISARPVEDCLRAARDRLR